MFSQIRFHIANGKVAEVKNTRREYSVSFPEVEDLDDTARGTGGYGSTGVKS